MGGVGWGQGGLGGRGGRDTGRHNSPLSWSPCQHGSLPSLSTSSGRFLSSGPALNWAELSWAEMSWAELSWAELGPTDSAGILAHHSRRSLIISRVDHGQQWDAEDTPIHYCTDNLEVWEERQRRNKQTLIPLDRRLKPAAKLETLLLLGRTACSCLYNNLLPCLSPSLSMLLYIPSCPVRLQTAAMAPSPSVGAVPGQSVGWTAEGPRVVPLWR